MVAANQGEGAIWIFMTVFASVALACLALFVVTHAAMALAEWALGSSVTLGYRRVEDHLVHTEVSLTPIYARHVEFETYFGEGILAHSIHSSEQVNRRVAEWIVDAARLDSIRQRREPVTK